MKIILAFFALATFAEPTAAFSFVAEANVSAYEFIHRNDPLILYDVDKTSNTGAISEAQSSDGGYDAALASPLNGGTLSATSYGSATESHYALASFTYQIVLNAPASVSARARVAFSGVVSSWGSGVADAEVEMFGADKDFMSSDYTGKAHLRSFASALTFVVNGGEQVPITFKTVTEIPPYQNVPSPGFASAYLDPVVTIGGVPEPATWVMLVAGFGLVGIVGRRPAVLAT